ncbi:MAG: TRAP transporter large permease [Vannielia sp.]|uniref:TRAP transporter large permease n=1 Tax=Rhodobacterales TaxID=204455 RepID=UPI002095BC24|nr:TRAP transporter large permease [Oceanicola sp. 502str15]MCO6384391.1 TRAP transporter large permease subunit [Oceanicola sp. 502str15]
MILTIFVVFFFLLIIGVPVAMAIGAAAMGAFWADGTFPMAQVPHKMVNGVYSFPLVAVPLFILAGALAGETSIAGRLVRLATALVGHIRGGLGHVNVASSMFFGGVSGSAVADTAAVGSLMIPAMEKQGYSREDAGAITITSSTIGILIPPSIPMVLYGVTVGSSVGALFLAGLVPGILVGLFLMVAVYVMAKRKGWPQAEHRAPVSELWAAFKDAILALLLPVFLLGAIVTGLTTATEAGVIGVVYALFLAGVVYREFSFRQLGTIVVEAAVNTAIPLFVVSTTSVVAWVVAIEQFPDTLVGFFNGLDASPWMVLLLMNLFLLIIGMFVDLVPALILFAPILLPVAMAQGVDPVQFGAIMVVNLGVGLITPPVGNCLYVGAAVAKVPVGRLVRASLPFLAINVLTLLLVTFVPQVSLFLPSLFY